MSDRFEPIEGQRLRDTKTDKLLGHINWYGLYHSIDASLEAFNVLAGEIKELQSRIEACVHAIDHLQQDSIELRDGRVKSSPMTATEVLRERIEHLAEGDAKIAEAGARVIQELTDAIRRGMPYGG